MRTLIFFNTLFGFLTIVAIVISLAILYLIFSKKIISSSEQLRSFLLILPVSVAVVSTMGSLIYSEVIEFIPCEYCWYQRYIMYPLSILLIYVAVTKKYVRVAAFFAGAGSLISTRHIYLQNGGGKVGVCASDVPCTLKYVEIFNLGNHKSEKLMDVVSLIEENLGKKAEINFLPMQPGDVPESFADIDKSIEMLDYKPTTNVDNGIEKLIKWYREFYE